MVPFYILIARDRSHVHQIHACCAQVSVGVIVHVVHKVSGGYSACCAQVSVGVIVHVVHKCQWGL